MYPALNKAMSSRPDAETSRRCPAQSADRRSNVQPRNRLTVCLRVCRLKCDRLKPCFNCTKRGQPGSCDYVKHDPHLRSARQQATNTQLQDRVRQLEDMVNSLLNGQTIPDQDVSTAARSPIVTNTGAQASDGGFTPSAAPSPYNQMDPNLPKPSSGKFTGAKSQESFVGSEHWESILDDITELKIDLENPETTEIDDHNPQILFGENHASRSKIMSSIPPKPVCDVLISRWFKTMDMAPSKLVRYLSRRLSKVLKSTQWWCTCQHS